MHVTRIELCMDDSSVQLILVNLALFSAIVKFRNNSIRLFCTMVLIGFIGGNLKRVEELGIVNPTSLANLLSVPLLVLMTLATLFQLKLLGKTTRLAMKLKCKASNKKS